MKRRVYSLTGVVWAGSPCLYAVCKTEAALCLGVHAESDPVDAQGKKGRKARRHEQAKVDKAAAAGRGRHKKNQQAVVKPGEIKKQRKKRMKKAVAPKTQGVSHGGVHKHHGSRQH